LHPLLQNQQPDSFDENFQTVRLMRIERRLTRQVIPPAGGR